MQITAHPFPVGPEAGRFPVREQAVEDKLRSVLNEFGGLSVDARSLSANDDLFAAGLTSFATVGVMLALEEAFDLEFPDFLLMRSTFTSINSLAIAVHRILADG